MVELLTSNNQLEASVIFFLVALFILKFVLL